MSTSSFRKTAYLRKTAYHHGDLRAALLGAAAELLEKQGAAGVVLREVARRAGVSHNAPYRHFPERDSLLAALAAEGFLLLSEQLKRHAGREMGEAYVAFALAHPHRFRLMFGGQLPLENYPALREASGQAYEALVAAFRERPDVADPAKAAAAAWALVHGLSHLLLDGHFAEAAGRNPAKFVQEVLGAMRFAAGAQRSA
jgi:AcrR family transcriptional regulator